MADRIDPTEFLQLNLVNQVIRGSATLLLIRALERSLGLVSTLILARILLPEDFGVTAIAILVIYLGDTIADTGAAQYITQVTEIDDDIVNTAWTLDVFLKGSVSLLLILLLPLFNFIWNNPDVVNAIGVLAPAIFIQAFANPQMHVDARNLEFRNIFFINTLVRIISFIVVVTSAFILKSFWALVIGYYAGAISLVAVSWIRYDRKVKFSKKNIMNQWQFSRWILSRGFLGYFRAQVDAFIIARYFPVGQFGNFSVAREITVMPATDILGPLTQPLLASLSRVKSDPIACAKQVRVAFLVISVITLPLCGYIFYFSDLIVAVLLGDRWIHAAAMMSAMTPLLFSFSLGGLTNNLMISIGQIRSLFFYDLISLTIVATVLIYFRNSSIETLILARSVTGFVVTSAATIWIARAVGVKVIQFILLFSGPLVLAVLSIKITTLINLDGALISFLVSGTLLVSIYSILVILLAMIAKDYSQSWKYLYDLVVHYSRVAASSLRSS